MLDLLHNKLDAYLRENNPDVVLPLEAEEAYKDFLLSKLDGLDGMIASMKQDEVPAYIIEEQCIHMLKEGFRPSRFNYVKEVLETDFESQFIKLMANGLLVYECVNIIEHCSEVFEHFVFNEANEDNGSLRLAITGTVSKYFEGVKM